jgi:crotonobetainyl-CoA:carnitine CoA-transferase CaiB-like acyl-CoA transferase
MDKRIAALLQEVGIQASEIDATIEGNDPIFATPFPIGEAAAIALGACGVATAVLWQERSGQRQTVQTTVARAAASLISTFLLQLEGQPLIQLGQVVRGNPLVNFYRCRDGRWIYLHGALQHLAAGTLKVLNCGAASEQISQAVKQWDAATLEDALAAEGMCGAMLRSSEEWQATLQGQALSTFGRIKIDKIGDSAPEPAGDRRRPLGGVRVLDLTRILAGPTIGRLLAEQGADVMLVNSPTLQNVPAFVVDTGQGKRSVYLNLDSAMQAEKLRKLASESDVFVQGYRTGTLAKRGFDSQSLMDVRPGIIYVTANCYGNIGPWQQRPGWEQLAETVSGLAYVQGTAERPALVPAAVCDYITGQLGALGVMAALYRRAHEGGSYHVQVSLCQTADWLISMGANCDRNRAQNLAAATLAPWLDTVETNFGELTYLSPVAQLSATPGYYSRPVVPLGYDMPIWPERSEI